MSKQRRNATSRKPDTGHLLGQWPHPDLPELSDCGNELELRESIRNMYAQEAILAQRAIDEGKLISLSQFVREAWAVLEPGRELHWSWHHDLICEWLTLISTQCFRLRYPEKIGVIINVPPRTGKSTLVTICWPVWTWLMSPERRFLCASYSSTLANDHGQKRRALVKSEWFENRFGTPFDIAIDRADYFSNQQSGYFQAVSPSGTVTGRGGDVCIGDDLLSADQARSAASKQYIHEWLDRTFLTRLNRGPGSAFVHVSQRLAPDDVPGYLLDSNPQDWVHLKIPREATKDTHTEFPLARDPTNPALPRSHFRPKGDILLREMTTPQYIESLKRNRQTWSTQQQQEPANSEGEIFPRAAWKYYKANDVLPTFDQVVVSVDCTFQGAKRDGHVAVHVYGIVDRLRYLLSRKAGPKTYGATRAEIKLACKGGSRVDWLSKPLPGAERVIIDGPANGSEIIDALRADPEIYGVVSLNGEGRKTSGALAASQDVERGECFLPADADWLPVFLEVMSRYTGEDSARHDDDVDALSQLVNWSRSKPLTLIARAATPEPGELPGTRYFEDKFGNRIYFDKEKELWCDCKTHQPRTNQF